MAFDPDVLRRSFAVVERRADQVALYFYAHLFAHNPGVRELFPQEMGEQRDRLFAALTYSSCVWTAPSGRPGICAPSVETTAGSR